MVRVVAPLMSLSASGTLKETLTYVCGLYLRRAKRAERFEYTQRRKKQETKFSQGCEVWQSLKEDKEKWRKFAEFVKKSGFCDVSLSYYMTGFQTFMSYYLAKGPGGWKNYPLPPIIIK